MKVIENKTISEIDTAIADYFTKCNIQYSVVYAGAHSDHNGNKWEHDKWLFTFIPTRNPKKSINFEYHTGIGHRAKRKNGWGRADTVAFKPAPTGLIHSVIMSGDACINSFADWCDNFGYDTDSRKALQTYEACQIGYNKLQSIFNNAEIEHLRGLLEDY